MHASYLIFLHFFLLLRHKKEVQLQIVHFFIDNSAKRFKLASELWYQRRFVYRLFVSAMYHQLTVVCSYIFLLCLCGTQFHDVLVSMLYDLCFSQMIYIWKEENEVKRNTQHELHNFKSNREYNWIGLFIRFFLFWNEAFNKMDWVINPTFHDLNDTWYQSSHQSIQEDFMEFSPNLNDHQLIK